jgi:two-component system sensor histidine kinase TctE
MDLHRLVVETVAAHAERAKSQNIFLKHQLTDGPAIVVGDQIMLREALSNLLGNALVHGGDSMSVVTVKLQDSGDFLHLEVSDDGRRVSPADVPNILARFGQEETGTGSGLGLSIAEAVARRHNGSLEVLEPDTGFAIRIVLPRIQR